MGLTCAKKGIDSKDSSGIDGKGNDDTCGE